MRYFIKVTPHTFSKFFTYVSAGLPRPLPDSTPFFYAGRGHDKASIILLLRHGIGFATEAEAQACIDANIAICPDHPGTRVKAASVVSLAEMSLKFDEIPATLTMAQHLALFHQEQGTKQEGWPNAISWAIAMHFANTASLHTILEKKVRPFDGVLNQSHLRKLVRQKIHSWIPLKTMGIFTKPTLGDIRKDELVIEDWIANQTNSLFDLSAVCFGLPFSAWTPNCGSLIDYAGIATVYENLVHEQKQSEAKLTPA